jgi:hypothetical protein
VSSFPPISFSLVPQLRLISSALPPHSLTFSFLTHYILHFRIRRNIPPKRAKTPLGSKRVRWDQVPHVAVNLNATARTTWKFLCLIPMLTSNAYALLTL